MYSTFSQFSSVTLPDAIDREPHSDGNKWGKMLLDGLQSARLLHTRMPVREPYPIYLLC